MEKETFR